MVQKLKFHPVHWLSFVFVLGSCNSCSNQNACPEEAMSETVAIHNPIYPKAGNAVNFSLFLINGALPKKVNLSIRTRQLQSDLSWSDATEVYTETWNDPVNFPLTKNMTSGFAANSLVTYKYEVNYNNTSDNYIHQVTFAINPYYFSIAGNPELAEPAPVYATADVSRACNIIFIPDMDLSDVVTRPGTMWQDYFYNSIRDNIKNGIFNEPSTRKYRQGFNFFINPSGGLVRSDENIFNQPVNYLKLNFASGRCYIHNAEFVDFSNVSPFMRSYSSRIYNRGTFMHESGHVLFHLADEYETNYGHWYDGIYPNNWETEDLAKSAAPSYGLRDEHVTYLEEPYATNKCYILCPYEGCQMGLAGLSAVNYGKPCAKAVTYWMDNYISP